MRARAHNCKRKTRTKAAPHLERQVFTTCSHAHKRIMHAAGQSGRRKHCDACRIIDGFQAIVPRPGGHSRKHCSNASRARAAPQSMQADNRAQFAGRHFSRQRLRRMHSCVAVRTLRTRTELRECMRERHARQHERRAQKCGGSCSGQHCRRIRCQTTRAGNALTTTTTAGLRLVHAHEARRFRTMR